MKALKYFWRLVPVLLTVFTCSVFSQGMMRSNNHGHMDMKNRFGNRMFVHQIYNYADAKSDSSIFDFYYSLVNDLLTFIKTDDDQYHAQYELTLVLYDSKRNPITEQFIIDEITVSTFDETNSRKNPQQGNITLKLPPDDYYYTVRIIENEVPQILVPMTKVRMRSFTPDRLHSSDIIFVDSVKMTLDSVKFYPNINGGFSNFKTDYTALMYLYPPKGAESIQIKYKISSSSGFDFAKFDSTYTINNFATIPFFINFKELHDKPGRYNLNVEIIAGQDKVKQMQHFTINWGQQIKQQETNLDLAIKQIKIVANRKSWNTINETQDKEKKKELYDLFWSNRDPTPGTPENELKEEFFKRVDFSNQNFIENYSGRGGWSTDRGQVYIKFGPPTRVERQRAEMNSPSYEIWYYSNIDRSYYFADREGNGTFRLVRTD